MAAPQSFRPAPITLHAMARNGGGRSTSHRLAQIADRYLAMLDAAPLPPLTDGEINALRDMCNGTIHEPAQLAIGALAQGFDDALLDGLAEKWEIDAAALAAKLAALSVPQQFRLIEDIEAYWADK